jgi:predicted small lipoprotein YifL
VVWFLLDLKLAVPLSLISFSFSLMECCFMMKKYVATFALSALVLAACGKKGRATGSPAPAAAPVASAPVPRTSYLLKKRC